MSISVIEQARIQAQVLVPLVKALQAELGEARANAIVRGALRDLYRGYGEAFWRVKREQTQDKSDPMSARPWRRHSPPTPVTTRRLHRDRAVGRRLCLRRDGLPLCRVLQGVGRARTRLPPGVQRRLRHCRRIRRRYRADARADDHAGRVALRFQIPAGEGVGRVGFTASIPSS